MLAGLALVVLSAGLSLSPTHLGSPAAVINAHAAQTCPVNDPDCGFDECDLLPDLCEPTDEPTDLPTSTPTVTPTATATPTPTVTQVPLAGSVVFHVKDKDTLDGIQASICPTDLPLVCVNTDANGNLTVDDVPPGDYSFTAKADGYVDQAKDVTVDEDSTTTVTYLMVAVVTSPTPTATPNVTPTPTPEATPTPTRAPEETPTPTPTAAVDVPVLPQTGTPLRPVAGGLLVAGLGLIFAGGLAMVLRRRRA
jgi:hypothetical protein